MTSVTSPQQTDRVGAETIPAPRGGQSVRLLVLGASDEAQQLRDRALAAGFELAQRYSARVSHVAYGDEIDPENARYDRIREAGLRLVPLQTCADELGLGAEAEAEAGVADTPELQRSAPEATDEAPADAAADATEAPAVHTTTDTATTPVELDEAASPASLDLSEEPAGELSEEPADELSDELSESAAGLVPGFDDDPQFDLELTKIYLAQSADQRDVELEPEADYTCPSTDEPELEFTPGSGYQPDPPLAAAVIGFDTWTGYTASTASEAATDSTDPTCADAAEPAADAHAVLDPAAPFSSARPRLVPRHLLASVAWAIIPLWSLGLLTPVAFGYAAFRLRSRALAFAALGYTFAVVLAFALSAARPHSATPGDASGALLTVALAGTWIGGTVHALSLRTRVFAR